VEKDEGEPKKSGGWSGRRLEGDRIGTTYPGRLGFSRGWSDTHHLKKKTFERWECRKREYGWVENIT